MSNDAPNESWRADESAIIDAGAVIGHRTRIWHFCHISSKATIGEDCVLGQNVFVADGCVIADRVKIQNNVSIYAGVELETDVFVGPSVVFTNVINPRAFIERKTEYQKTLVQEGATLGANSTIVCGNTVGKFAMIGAGATITHSVKPFALMAGVPARQLGWVSRAGVKLDLPLHGNEEVICNASGKRYHLNGMDVEEKELL